MPEKVLIIKGHIVDPSQGIDGIGSILIEKGMIKGLFLSNEFEGGSIHMRIIDAKGALVLPGLVDMHAHLREPGYEHKETIQTGTFAALRGGFTALCPMPNTNPVNDNATVTSFIIRKAFQEGYCKVYPIGAITKGQKGTELAEMALMYEAGAVAFSDDGRPVMNSLVMRRALEYSKVLDVPIISHAEDLTLSEGGVMNEGIISSSLGLRGIPRVAEDIMVARDIALAKITGGRLHIAHVSTSGSVELIRRAKQEGVKVTAETCPHYFTLTEDAVLGYNTNAKVNPPLRTSEDILAIKEGLRDGTIDVIATDHAPHHRDEKMLDFDNAPFGISGFETALSLSLELVREDVLTLNDLVTKLSLNPSNIMRISSGTLKVDSDADITIVDPHRKYKLTEEYIYSKGKNTPLLNNELTGKILYTITKGRIYCHEPA